MGKFVRWRGEAIKARVRQAAIMGVNETMADAGMHATQNHPGWIYRSGTAERSVQIQQTAAPDGRGVRGTWGSVGTNYVLILELKHGSFLRNAADAKYPGLPGAIRRHYG